MTNQVPQGCSPALLHNLESGTGFCSEVSRRAALRFPFGVGACKGLSTQTSPFKGTAATRWLRRAPRLLCVVLCFFFFKFNKKRNFFSLPPSLPPPSP